MKNISFFTAIIALFCFFVSCGNSSDKNEESIDSISEEINNIISPNINKIELTMDNIIDNITWYGQACVKIKFEDKNIFFDPFNIKEKEIADVIFITHTHSDHFSPESLKKVITEKTQFFAPVDCAKVLRDSGFMNVKEVKPDSSFSVSNIKVKAIPAYNIDKTDFHPKENNWVGYLVELNGIKVYHPGDTERIPEMQDINCDLTFMPLGQTYTMNSVEDAANSVLDTKAKIAIPFHYGMYEGKKEDAEMFKKILANKVNVVIKEH